MTKNLPTTGVDPNSANAARRFERELDVSCRRLRITSSSGRIARKRKKRLHIVERGQYRALIVLVAQDLARRPAAAERSAA